MWGDKVYFTTPDAFLIALNAATGNIIFETKIAEAKDGYWSPAAPLVVKGKVLAGVAPSDHGSFSLGPIIASCLRTLLRIPSASSSVMYGTARFEMLMMSPGMTRII